jgi:alpha/beta superfamily hydrolase
VHPDHGVLGTLRMALANKGFSTQSIQMPVLTADAPPESYAPLFPLAAERIAAAAAWIGERGYRARVLVSHRLGSRMANAYFDAAGNPAFRGWVALGLGAERRPSPVLDVPGEADLPAVLAPAPARRRVADSTAGGKQRTIRGADHFYAGPHAELINAITGFAAR